MNRSRWSDVTADPNDAVALAMRQSELRQARQLPVSDRTQLLVDIARGRRVLDLGCVDHFADASARPGFLHSELCAAAKHCVGVDINDTGVRELRAQGFDVLTGDITQPDDVVAIAQRGPFDVIVAGEVLEHLDRPAALFELASRCLAGSGKLVITTPNPYAPHRVSAGRRMIVWENVDHRYYAFPSGVVELAGASGLRLDAWMTTGPRSWRVPSFMIGRWAQYRVRSIRERLTRGPTTVRRDPHDLRLLDIVSVATGSRAERARLGETSIYVLSLK